MGYANLQHAAAPETFVMRRPANRHRPTRQPLGQITPQRAVQPFEPHNPIRLPNLDREHQLARL